MTALHTSPLVKTYTLKEFWKLEQPEDRCKLELIAGVLFMTPPPDSVHDAIAARLLRLLNVYLDGHKDKGKLFVPRAAIWTGSDTYLEPDLFYISAKLEAAMDSERRESADLVVEIASPASMVDDRTTKADTYAALGVKELWLVDQAQETIEVRYLKEGAYGPGKVLQIGQRIESNVIQGLDFAVEEIFKD